MSLFESISGAKLKDCIVDNDLLFIVEEGQIGKAIGKKAANVRMLENVLKKKIRIIEFNPDISGFIKNLIYPINAKEINQEDGVVTIAVDGIDAKSRLIGRDRKNINFVKSIVKRYFSVEEIKVK
jgi:N utilization substance protein A|tara:strand:+ start:123 stop:497 length:375 start_codon:yes stop_codon:yes gene_type:complete